MDKKLSAIGYQLSVRASLVFVWLGIGLMNIVAIPSWADDRAVESARSAVRLASCPPSSGLQLGKGVGSKQPSGSLLAFSAFVDGNWDIFTWDFDASRQPVKRTHTPYDESGPSLATDHSFCVYETVDGKLWRLALQEGVSPEALPFGSDQKLDMHPAVSPDGGSVAMSTSLDRSSDDSDLIVYDLAAKKFGRRLELLAFQHYPAWAPDGKHVAFGNLHGRLWTGGPISEIWIMRTDAPWARQVTMLDSLSISPSWSPRGDRIAFASNRGSNFDIWLVDPQTREYVKLTHHEAADTDPIYSPDGNSIIFVSTRSGEPALWKIDIQSHKVTPVTPFGPGTKVPCKDPDWR